MYRKATLVQMVGVGVLLAALGTSALGQEDATPRELLPDLGQIGAQVGVLVGFSENPFRADEGFISGGTIDLPLMNAPGGKLSYEILVSLQRATTDTEVTSAVIALVNNAISGDLMSPLPVTNRVEERMKVLTGKF